ncbi:MAG: ATP synthase F1 subunit gamma [Phycisphaerae bacterium]
MANPRVLVKRRNSVRNIRKITRTMQLIATSKFQKALGRATSSKPYADKIGDLVADLSTSGAQVDHPLLKQNPDAQKSALLLISSNRGLCGGYNSSLLRLAQARLASAEQPVDLHVVGKKGVGYFKFLKQTMARALTDFADTPAFTDVEPFAVDFMRQYEAGAYSAVNVVYMQFHSAARQEPTCVQLLPIGGDAQQDEAHAADQTEGQTQYDFSPTPQELLAQLLPVTVKVRLFQCFMDAHVSEQVARMVAMKAATDAADDMIKTLSGQYNRARQSQITSELLDIIGGAEALK